MRVFSQVMFKVTCYEKYHKHIAALFKTIGKICQENNGSRGEILTMRLKANHSFYKVLCSLTAFTGLAYLYQPLKSFILDRQLVPLLPIEFFFIDQSKAIEFVVANVVMVITAAFAISAIAYIGLNFFVIIMSFAPLVDLVQADFDELDELWCGPSTLNLLYRRRFLNNICRKYIDLLRYES